jgi:hypothetical protein
MEAKEIIRAAWLEVMPNSHAMAGVALTSTYVKLYLQQPQEWQNGIAENDPLSYIGFIEGDKFVEEGIRLLVKPVNPYMAYSGVNLRKASTKIEHAALVKRFTRVRAFILAEFNLFDISSKVVDIVIVSR